MPLRDQAIYCLPDGTLIRACAAKSADSATAWELRDPATGVLQYTIGPDGCLTGYAIEEQMSGEQRYEPFPTDITLEDLQPV